MLQKEPTLAPLEPGLCSPALLPQSYSFFADTRSQLAQGKGLVPESLFTRRKVTSFRFVSATNHAGSGLKRFACLGKEQSTECCPVKIILISKNNFS